MNPVVPIFIESGGSGTVVDVFDSSDAKIGQLIQKSYNNLGLQLKGNSVVYDTIGSITYDVDEVIINIDGKRFLVGIPSSLSNLIILLNRLDIAWFHLNDDTDIVAEGFHTFGNIIKTANGVDVVLFSSGIPFPNTNTPTIADAIREIALVTKNISNLNSDQPFSFSPQIKNTVLAGPNFGNPDDPTFRLFSFTELQDTFLFNGNAGRMPIVSDSLSNLIPINLFSVPPIFVKAATSARLRNYTYDNNVTGIGATITMDATGPPPRINGRSMGLGEAFLLTSSDDDIHNGIYVWTTVTGNSVATRATNSNQTFQLYPQYVIVTEGDTLSGNVYQQQTANPVVGTDDIVYEYYGTPPAASSAVTLTGTQTLSNKSLVDATTLIIDDAAPTKKFRFEASSITAGATRVLTVQDKTGLLTLQATAFTSTRVPFINPALLLTDDEDFTYGAGQLFLGSTAGGRGRLNLSGATSGSVTLQTASVVTDWDFTLPSVPGTNGYFLKTNGAGVTSWDLPSSTGANTALSNLASVSINTSLLAQTGVDLGSTANPFRTLYLFGSGTYGTNSIEVRSNPTADRIITLPDVTGTVYTTATGSISSTQLRTSISDETGTGVLVFANTPTLITPVLGVATATSINGLTLTATTGTFTLTNAKVFTVSNTLTLTATDGSTLAIGAGGTLGSNAYTSTAFAPLASPTFTGTVTIPTPFTLGAISVTTTGTQLNYINAATGTTGTTSTNIVFSTSPTLVTPALGVATATSINGLTITSSTGTFTLTNAKTFAVTHSLTLAGTDSTTMTFPGASDTVAGLAAVQTFITGAKTFNSSILNIRNPAGTFSYTIVGGANVSDKSLTLPVITADDTFAVLGANQSFSGSQTFSARIRVAGQINGSATSAVTYRLINGGSTVTPAFYLNDANPASVGVKSVAVEGTNGISLIAGNASSVAIARASIQITNLVNTAGSEAGDLAFLTQTGGAAAVNNMTLFAAGNFGVKAGISAGVTAMVGGKIFNQSTTVGTPASSTETDLHTYTILASTLSNNNSGVEGKFAGQFAANATTKQIRGYFGGTLVFDTGALVFNSGDWEVEIFVQRVSSTVVRVSAKFNTSNATLSAYAKYTEVTGLTLTNTQIIKVTGTAGVGAASSDITCTVSKVIYEQAA